MSIISFVRGEQSLHGVVSRNDKPGEVDEEFSGDVEEDEEEVESNKPEEDIDFGNGCLSLEIVEHRILRKFFIYLTDGVVDLILNRHDDGYLEDYLDDRAWVC